MTWEAKFPSKFAIFFDYKNPGTTIVCVNFSWLKKIYNTNFCFLNIVQFLLLWLFRDFSKIGVQFIINTRKKVQQAGLLLTLWAQKNGQKIEGILCTKNKADKISKDISCTKNKADKIEDILCTKNKADKKSEHISCKKMMTDMRILRRDDGFTYFIYRIIIFVINK